MKDKLFGRSGREPGTAVGLRLKFKPSNHKNPNGRIDPYTLGLIPVASVLSSL